jgi:LysR family transcriptional regulator, glycine cleavage system transcriptional activator
MPALNALKAFEAAGTTGSLTRAADLLNVTQSAVSSQVRQLEEQLGETLFSRRHQHLELTPAGRLLLRALQQSFDKIELTVRTIQQESDANRLRINVPPTFAARWLLPRLPRLREQFPQLELTLTTRQQDDIADSNRLDCAIRFGDGQWDGLDSTLLMHEQHIAVASPELLARIAGDSPIDRSRFTLLHVLAAENQRYLTWQHWLDAAHIEGVDTVGGYEFDLLDLSIRAAIDGLGITIADRHMIDRELASGALRQVLDVQVEGRRSYWFVVRPEQRASSAQAARRDCSNNGFRMKSPVLLSGRSRVQADVFISFGVETILPRFALAFAFQRGGVDYILVHSSLR